MSECRDGPASPLFNPLIMKGNTSLSELHSVGISSEMVSALALAPSGSCVAWGIPFEIDKVVALKKQDVTVEVDSFKARWFIFMHTSDSRPIEKRP